MSPSVAEPKQKSSQQSITAEVNQSHLDGQSDQRYYNKPITTRTKNMKVTESKAVFTVLLIGHWI